MLVICREISSSDSSLDKICDAKKYLPVASTVISWVAEGGRWSEQYAYAKQAQADYLAHQVIDIADTDTDAKKAKNRIEARIWYASKLNPKKYGDKLELNGSIESTGRDVASLETALAIAAVCNRIMAKAELENKPKQITRKEEE